MDELAKKRSESVEAKKQRKKREQARLKLEIGERIRHLRTGSGLSMEDFAVLIDSTSGTISNIENGKNIPGAEILTKISNVFHVSADWLLHGESEDKLKETQARFIFFRKRWQFFIQSGMEYMKAEDAEIVDAVFELLENVQHLTAEELALLSQLAAKINAGKNL